MLFPYTLTDNNASLRFVRSGCVVVVLDGIKDNSYFVKDGRVLGYDFDLIQKYSKKIERNPVFIVEKNVEKRLDLLLSNEIDIAICDATDSISEFGGVNFIYINDEISSTIWVVNNKNAGFAKDINLWLKSYKKTNEYSYFTSYYNSEKGKKTEGKAQISEYDFLIQKYSRKIGWDWRLISSLVYQESRFISTVKSRKGATGLMQLVPKTAAFLGVDNIEDDEKNIEAGTKLVKYLDDYYAKDSTITQTERIKFVLAAYNSGHGRIDICRKSTEMNGYDSSNWADVVNSRKNKNPQKISAKSFLSKETVLFVHEILERYEHYKNLFPEIIIHSELFSLD